MKLEAAVGPCVETTHTRTPQGYGRIDIDGKTLQHHRYVYCQHHKLQLQDIVGKVVMHKCDNPPCINPDHLQLGTVAENNADKLAKGHNVGFAKGNTSGRVSLTEEQVRQIKQRRRDLLKDIAADYGIAVSLVSMILSGKRWSNVN